MRPRSPAPLQVRLPGLLTKNVILEHTKGNPVWVGILERHSAASPSSGHFSQEHAINHYYLKTYNPPQNLVTARDRYHKTTIHSGFNVSDIAKVGARQPSSLGR